MASRLGQITHLQPISILRVYLYEFAAGPSGFSPKYIDGYVDDCQVMYITVL